MIWKKVYQVRRHVAPPFHSISKNPTFFEEACSTLEFILFLSTSHILPIMNYCSSWADPGLPIGGGALLTGKTRRAQNPIGGHWFSHPGEGGSNLLGGCHGHFREVKGRWEGHMPPLPPGSAYAILCGWHARFAAHMQVLEKIQRNYTNSTGGQDFWAMLRVYKSLACVQWKANFCEQIWSYAGRHSMKNTA